MPMRLLNRFRKRKIFVIGFHKCGTTSLHRFFQRNFIASAHFAADGAHIATTISHNLAKKRRILRNIDRFNAYSDMCFYSDDAWIEANKYFRELHREYPDALFIFNDRPVENWIGSRLKKRGLAEIAERHFKVDRAGVEAIWREHYAAHRQAVLDYAPAMENFLHYDIESDPPARLLDFVGRAFAVSPKTLRHENPTAFKEAKRLRNAAKAARKGGGAVA
jgi:hypothetical protein